MSKCSPLITNIRLIIVTSNARTSSEPKINKGDSLMLAGGRVSWTQYKFRGDSYILSQDEYHALRQLNSPQLEKLLRDIRADRWAQFRDSHRGLLWIAVVAAVCVVLALAVPFFGIIAYFAWVCLLSLGLSALSRSFALNRECRFFQRSHKIATESPTYEAFCEAYLREIADFQVLRRATYYYVVNLYEDPVRERHAAANTFIVLGWPAEWNEANELVHYPDLSNDTANSIRISLHPTNHPRASLIHTSISLKSTARNRDSQEKRITMFGEALQQEFKKFGLALCDADAMWTGSAPIKSLSPFWRKNASGSFSLDYLPGSNETQTTLPSQ